jgi:hypothetical protein
VDDILHQIESTYETLAEPKFHFVKRALVERPYDRLVESVKSDFDLYETTEEEEDHAFMYALDREGKEWVLGISMVGPFAVFARTNPDQSWSKIIIPSDTDLSSRERSVVEKLTAAGLHLLKQEELERAIPLKLFIAEPENVRVFQALFTDTDILPWDIDGLRNAGAI